MESTVHDRADDSAVRHASARAQRTPANIHRIDTYRIGGPVATALAYLLTAALGEALAFPSAPVSALWAPNAIVLAALLLTPVHRWWIYLAAVLPVHVIAQASGTALAQIGIQYIFNCAEALIGAAALLRFETEPRRVGQLSSMTNLILIGGIAAPLITSVAMALSFATLEMAQDFWLTVLARTSTNTFATITLVPLILHVIARPAVWQIPERRRLIEAAAIGILLAAICVYVFVGFGGDDERAPALLYAPLPLLIWATVRFEIVGVCTSVLLVGALATWGVLHDVGPFVAHAPVRNALTTVLFLNVICIPLLMLAAVLKERKAAAAEAACRDQALAHLARVATLGEISGAVAHEIRQPLASMLANAEAAAVLLATKKVDVEQVRPIVADIISDNRRAAQVIKRIQSMLRYSESERRLEHVNELAIETLALSRTDLRRRHVQVIQNLAAGLPRVAVDRVQIQQVILNLIVNACDAMENIALGERRLWISTTMNVPGTVELAIRDSGCGVDEQMLEQIFQPFFTTKLNGLGLGLSISKKIVAIHGGRLWGERSCVGGAIFRVTLPAGSRDC